MEKAIFSYWHQGFDEAPPVVTSCSDRLVRCHEDWTVHLLDSESVWDWIDPIPVEDSKLERLGLAHRSDLIRTQLLNRYGGVWVDPTVWVVQPFDEWLPEYLEVGLFMFFKPGPDRMISNWFIASERGHPLLERLYSELCRYWNENDFKDGESGQGWLAGLLHRFLKKNADLARLWLRRPVISLLRTYPYMIYHYMFYDLVRHEPDLFEIWQAMPKVSADGPHRMLRRGLLEPVDEQVKCLIDSGEDFLYKLTWKLSQAEIPPGSVLDYLVGDRGAVNADAVTVQ